MTDFRRALDRLRQADPRSRCSISEQLRWLREPSGARPLQRVHASRTTLPTGRTVRTELGAFYSVPTAYPLDHCHGQVRLGGFSVEALSVLLRLAACPYETSDRERIAFLDTETTGLHGGAGMCPFMIGVGFFRKTSFDILQYFIRDFDEEPAMLLALGELLGNFDLIVTYNGRAFDLPLVENRCVISRLRGPFDRLIHLDLLFTARRLWRIGHGSCRLTTLEERVLRFPRGPDVPGSRIPRVYFDYLQTGDATDLGSVFSHNVYDILSLAALTLVAADRVNDPPTPWDDPLDVYSLGRVFDRAGDRERSIHCYELALRSSLPWGLRRPALERLSILYRRIGEHDRSLECCQEVMAASEFSMLAYEGASIYHERQARDPLTACRIMNQAIERIRKHPGMERRQARLEARRDRLSRKLAG